jgi:diaminopimelate epimerase
MFPNGVNVQFAKRISETEVAILIYERGVGYTLASGSSSCAVASVMVKNKLTLPQVNIQMPGGVLDIAISSNWDITMIGEVQEIAHGALSKEMVY